MPEVEEVYTDTFQEITQVRLMRPACLGGNLDVSAERIDMASDGYAYVFVAGELEMSVGNVAGWVNKSYLVTK